jgi:type II secretory pathway component PulF
MLDNEAEVRSKMTTALAYPTVLLTIAVATVMLIFYYVVPQFTKVISDVGGEIEGFAGTVSKISEFATSPLGLILTFVFIAGPIAWIRWARDNKRESFDGAIAKIPFVGRLMMLGELARVATMLRMMTANGIPMRDALERTRDAVTHSYVRKVLRAVIDNVENGRSMAEAFQRFDDLPGEVSEMIAVGEESGRVQSMLEHLASTLSRRLSTAVERAPVVLQPVMLLAVGGLVVGIFATYFLPYINLLTALSHAQ